MSLICPHCGAKGRIRSSRSVTPTYRQLVVDCTNDACQHRYGACEERFFSVLYSIRPSRTPSAKVALAMTPGCQKLLKLKHPANDTGPGGPEVSLPRAANDDAPASEAM